MLIYSLIAVAATYGIYRYLRILAGMMIFMAMRR